MKWIGTTVRADAGHLSGATQGLCVGDDLDGAGSGGVPERPAVLKHRRDVLEVPEVVQAHDGVRMTMSQQHRIDGRQVPRWAQATHKGYM